MEGYEQNDGMDTNDRDEIYSNAVKAGKRTYFFDVKATRINDYYLTITESKKKFEITVIQATRNIKCSCIKKTLTSLSKA